MILRRTKNDPNAAINDLTRDLGRIRTDLENIRLALSARGRAAMREAGERIGEQTTRAGQSTREYAREHPGMTSGMAVGLLGVMALIFYGLSSMRR